jgi:hypothetical protein
VVWLSRFQSLDRILEQTDLLIAKLQVFFKLALSLLKSLLLSLEVFLYSDVVLVELVFNPDVVSDPRMQIINSHILLLYLGAEFGVEMEGFDELELEECMFIDV